MSDHEKITLDEASESFQQRKIEWLANARQQTVDTLPEFIKGLTEKYGHDYGTICHAMTAAAIAAMTAVNKSPQGGITGFQAGCVMWGFIKEWNYSANKTGLKLVDYDNFLYPQYEDAFGKFLSRDIWKALIKEAASNLADADEKYAKYREDHKQYSVDISDFIVRHPDYYENKVHYDHIGFGTASEHDREAQKVKEGFDFAPTEPYEPIYKHSPVYRHWETIVNGVVPFGYKIKDV